jgi:hypothetical protein
MNCWECETKPSDYKLVCYRDTVTNKLYPGARNFCSDQCESKYHAKMVVDNATDRYIKVPIE